MSARFERLVAVDWGTSSLRGALLDAAGRVLEQRSSERGILSVPVGQFATVFEAHFEDWLAAAGTFCVISGMAGSRQGWIEAPYCACPAGFDEIAARLAWIEPRRIALVPGLSCEHDGVPDVLRGEEVQIVGALALLGLQDGIFALPGTHSKWARVQDGRVIGFRTFMTGEFYALLGRHSILARTLDIEAPLDEPAFLDGVARAGADDRQGLLHSVFGTRTLALFERLNATTAASYLSGLLIGAELHAQARLVQQQAPVVLIGAESLTQRYRIALTSLGQPSRSLGAQATWAGLHAIAQHIDDKER